MELSEFVKVTLQQIVEGVSSAQDAIAAKGASINPTEMEFYKDGQWSNYSHAMPQQVEFDVGLTSTDKKGNTEGIGVFLGSINLGKKNDVGVESVAVTRVRFAVPLVLPPGASLKKNGKQKA